MKNITTIIVVKRKLKEYNRRVTVTTIEELGKLIDLTDEEKTWNEKGPNTLPLLISDNIIPLLGNPAIRRQFVPSAEENRDIYGTSDPQLEGKYSVTPRFVRRYHNRAAFLVTDTCFAYCRHCFRRRFAGSMIGPCTDDDIASVASFLKEHREIKEVLLTGGDMFTLSDERFEKLLSTLKAAREDVIYRLCTRALVSNPARFTPSLFSIIEKNSHGAPFYLMTQFNHPAEITAGAEEALRGFVRLGIPMMNQSVLLRGVNDSIEVQEELSQRLLMARIKPYYLFQGDLVKGTRHLRVPVSDGIRLEKEMRIRLSGLGMPVYTIDLPEGGGKVPLSNCYLSSLEDGIWTITTPDGETRHYPD